MNYVVMMVACMQLRVPAAVTARESKASDGATETYVAIGPTTRSSDTFSGVGGASGGGGGTRLLVDYPTQQRSDILDMLFKPQFGASLQHLKVEVGCDGDTTQGSEPTHARSATDIDFGRGYEVWFMEEAVKRRPDIQLSGLEWGIPGWVAADPDGFFGTTNVEYLTGWATGLRDKKGLNLTALAVAYNERTYSSAFIKKMRQSLNNNGLSHVKTIAPDSWGHMWAIINDMKQDEDLTAAIDVIGTHQECYGAMAQMPPSGTMTLGKPLWSTELHIGEIGSYAGCDGKNTSTQHSIDLPAWDFRAGLHLARALNRGYLTANMTSTLIWTPIYSWYEYLLYGGKGLIIANTPWSGWYNIPDAVWMVAHTTQFAQPGWMFANRDACKLLSDGAGSVVSYISPTGKELTIVIETAQSNIINTVKIQLRGAFASLKQLHIWKSTRGAVFIKQPPLAVASGVASVTLEPGTVVTLTTTTGQTKGGADHMIPSRTNFSLPYSDNFDALRDDQAPRFTSDMHGVFTAVGEPNIGGKILQQQTMSRPVSTAGGGNIYATIIGDGSWIDYEVSIAARLPKDDPAELESFVEAADVCVLNETVGRCGGLTQQPNATSMAECKALCCAMWRTPGEDCETAQWCPKGVTECDTKWAKSGRCWIGKLCGSTDTSGWQTAARGNLPPAPSPKPPSPKSSHTPFLFLASHIGVFKGGSTCILSGKPLPDLCDKPLRPGRADSDATSESCCSTGKDGLVPAMIHSSGTPDPAGFVFRIDFDAAGGKNAKWLLQTAKSCEDSGRGCATRIVATGALSWALGEWMTLKLAAQRQSNGTTELKWSVSGVNGASEGPIHTATVDTISEARGGVAFGNGLEVHPKSQWDNLTITPLRTAIK